MYISTMATDDALKDRCLFSLRSLYIVYMYISTMGTDDALTPCVSRSSADAILTLCERSVLVFFEIAIYSVHVYQYHGYWWCSDYLSVSQGHQQPRYWLCMKDRCLFSLRSLYIMFMYICTMATDDVLTPCVSRSSAAAILTLYERSVLVFFDIVQYIYLKSFMSANNRVRDMRWNY